MKITAVTMIRNEIDIIADFLAHQLQFFDELLIADMQSSDGTTEVIDRFSEETDRVKRFNFPYSVTHQSETLTRLSKIAFEQGADWVFSLDADEFLSLESRVDLVDKLEAFGSEVMHLPWINLVPSTYGSFGEFDLKQEFYWSGQLSKFLKVAISAQYANTNPHYIITTGSHNIRPNSVGSPEEPIPGLPLLHVPVRSLERLKYKASNAIDINKRMHNYNSGQNYHYQSHLQILKGKAVDVDLLNGIAQDYGSKAPINPVNPKASCWPTIQIKIPELNQTVPKTSPISPLELRRLDAHRNWMPINQPKNATVSAVIEKNEFRIRPQAIRGNGLRGDTFFKTLSKGYNPSGEVLDQKGVSSALKASLIPHPVDVPSAWTDLVPCLGILFSLAKPRRFVELGTHNGMSYFSACQLSDELELGTQCIAVDSWEGEPHAGIHAPEIFTNFEANLKSLFPSQMYMKTYFDEASKVFDIGSIDLIHIDGFHSYEAVKKDFESWLPKMSDRAIMIFHDTNVHERGFGVWRFWQEVSQEYPHFEVYHGHGLGILYVGRESSEVAKIFSFLEENSEFGKEAVTLLERQIEVEKIGKQKRKRASALERNQMAKRCDQLQQQLAKQDQLAKRCDQLQQQLAKQDQLAKRCHQLEQQLVKQNKNLSAIENNKWWLRLQKVSRFKKALFGRRGRVEK